MLPLLLVLGATGALLEIKRLVNKPPQDGDAIRLKQSEERLRRVLQEVQQELQRARSEQQRDQQRAEELEKTAADLRKAGVELRERSHELHHKALGLDNENEQLKQEVRDLHSQHEQELQHEESKHMTQLEDLKQNIASLLEDFSGGRLDSTSLRERLEVMGVDVQISAEEFRTLPEADSHQNREPKRIELQVDTDFRSQLRLVSDCPERMAKLVAEGAHRATGLLSSGSSDKAFPVVKTPPSVRKEVSLFSSRNRVPGSLQANEGKENNVRPVLADVTPLTQDAAKTTTKTTSKEPQKAQSGGRRQGVPKMSIAKQSRQSGQALPSREAFALTDLTLENDHSPIMRHSALGF